MTVIVALQTKEGKYLIADRKYSTDDTFYLDGKIDKYKGAVFATAGDAAPWELIKKLLEKINFEEQSEDYFLYGGFYSLIEEKLYGKIGGIVQGFVSYRDEIVSFTIDLTEKSSSAAIIGQNVSAMGSGAADFMATIKAFSVTTNWSSLEAAKKAIPLVASYNGTISKQFNVVKL